MELLEPPRHHTPPPAAGPPVVEMHGVDFAYNGRPVLERVELRVVRGDFTAVVGPNGGGKTTLIKLILGLEKPQAGTVRVLGGTPRQARGRLGYVAQRPELDPAFPVTVGEVVLMGRQGPGAGLGPFWSPGHRSAARSALGRVGLGGLWKRPFAQLSGGQRQRVLVARALAAGPEMLIMDEPTVGVDPAAEQELYELFRELNRDMTIIMVSHEPGFVSPYVGQVICVNRQVATHPTAEVNDEVIQAMYGRPVRLVRHDHQGPPGGCACE